jgi:Gram-negative bacterial TonB protein C-terminal
MRLLAIFAFMCAWNASAQPNQAVESNMSCVERLELPLYPPLANAARIRGTVTAIVTVSPDGTVQKTIAEVGAHRLLVPAVEKSVRASKFSKTCGGKSVRLVFNFVLAEELDPDKLPQRVSFSYPNQFSISVPPRMLQP